MKNEYFTQEKTLERKFAEVFAAWDLEREYGKEEIFELYVNTIYFGSGYYGIREAAQGYFSKAPSELSDYEAIMLAGLPNAPSAYSPGWCIISRRLGKIFKNPSFVWRFYYEKPDFCCADDRDYHHKAVA